MTQSRRHEQHRDAPAASRGMPQRPYICSHSKATHPLGVPHRRWRCARDRHPVPPAQHVHVERPVGRGLAIDDRSGCRGGRQRTRDGQQDGMRHTREGESRHGAAACESSSRQQQPPAASRGSSRSAGAPVAPVSVNSIWPMSKLMPCPVAFTNASFSAHSRLQQARRRSSGQASSRSAKGSTREGARAACQRQQLAHELRLLRALAPREAYRGPLARAELLIVAVPEVAHVALPPPPPRAQRRGDVHAHHAHRLGSQHHVLALRRAWSERGECSSS